MAKMIELMRQSAVPANVMRAAAKGALVLPPSEVIEILVYLTTNPVFGEQARLTLAGWDEVSSIAVASDPDTAREVLDYLTAPENLRPRLLPTLVENPAITEEKLVELAQLSSRPVVAIMLASPRVRQSPNVLQALSANLQLSDLEAQQVKDWLAALGETAGQTAAAGAEAGEKAQWEIEHAAEIAAEEGKAFELVGGTLEEEEPADAPPPPPAAEGTGTAEAPAPAAVDEKTLKMRKAEGDSRERISSFQKISRLTVGERVQLAMRGTKDERSILVRDGSKVVSSAVLNSPKLSEQEVETFAAMKNVQEGVLREIARNRKFMKNYAVVRSLVNNPRSPLDLSLTLVKNLLLMDLKALSMNKNVPETLRKIALKSFKEKSEASRRKRE